MSWSRNATPFSYPVFCVWKTQNGKLKERVVVDIRGLNAITQPDAYPIPIQADIISAVQNCDYITVVDYTSFFYQWRVHPDHRPRLTVVTHRGQENFNVAVMGYKNSIAYVQRQIDRLLWPYKNFARAYVDDIVIFSRTLTEHLTHLNAIFSMLKENNISIKPTKAFLAYPTVQLLGQKVTSLGLSTSEEKLRAIAKLEFPSNLRQLETYLGLTGWLRNYIPYYAGIAKPLQDRKTELLSLAPKSGNSRRSFASKTKVLNPTARELASFKTIQDLLSCPSYLVHPDPERQIFIDLDASKEFGFGAMIYHLKGNLATGDYPARKAVEPILFLSQLLNPAETRYWPTELELAGIVWVLRKIRHIIESAKYPTLIFTDHGAALGIAKQTLLSTSSTDKLNLRLIRASEYLQRFNIEIRYKPGKQHIVPDILSRLASTNLDVKPVSMEGELDALFTVSLVQMEPAFKQKILDGYKSDLNWKNISSILNKDNKTRLPFFRGSDGLIYQSDGLTTGDHAFQPARLCIPWPVVQDILQISHDQSHPGFTKCYELISSSYYICGLTRYLRAYLHHCPKCQVYQTRRYCPYGSLQPVLTPAIPYHTIILDFILALPEYQGFDTVMSVTCKFTKKIAAIPGNAKWSASQWGNDLLDRLDIADWGIPKVIISDRDRKFLSELWSAMFKKLGVKLLYSTAYHPQTDGQSERSNQTLEIALRFQISHDTSYGQLNWPGILPNIQRGLNNSWSATTNKTPNKAALGFTPATELDLLKPSADRVNPTKTRLDVVNSIAFAQMNSKFHYNRKH